MKDDPRRIKKRNGRQAAKEWLKTSQTGDVVALAGLDFEYGETLTQLQNEGFEVPPSDDVDFSWGFFKHVKGHVYHRVYQPAN